MSHNIAHTTRPVVIALGGNYAVEIFNTVVRTAEAEGVYSYAYIIDGGGSMDLISLSTAHIPTIHAEPTIDDIVVEARRIIRNYSGLSRVLNEIDNTEGNS